MWVFGALLIPFVFALVLLTFFQRRIKWWEVAIPFAVSFVIILGAKAIVETTQTMDTEIWGGWATEARFYEDWNEYIYRTCKTCVATDSKTGACTSEVTWDCSYVQDHPEEWEVWDSNGEAHSVSREAYNYFVGLFRMSPKFQEMNRPSYTKDGDMYHVDWPGSKETVEPLTTFHRYENRVQASHSVFQFEEVSQREVKERGLFDYPGSSLFNYPSILGDCGPYTFKANADLRYYNAVLGRKKQLRIWMLCFQNENLQTAHLQEALWKGGNKNEVVIIVSRNADSSVRWSHVFSWTDNKTPLVEIRNFIAGQEKFDPTATVKAAALELETSFVRKPFADFSYLTVDPPTWAVVLVFCLTIVCNLGVSWWVVENEYEDTSEENSRGRRHYRHT